MKNLRRRLRAVDRRLEPQLRRAESWVMTGRHQRLRAFMLLVAPFALGAAGLGYAGHSRQLESWALLGVFFAWVAATTLIDARARARGRPLPVCRCRRAALGLTLPVGAVRYARLFVAWAALALAFLFASSSLALTLFWIWVGVSYMVAVRQRYVGSPEVGGAPFSVDASRGRHRLQSVVFD